MQALLMSAAADATAYPSWFVVLLGLGTVFVGLICIVLICKLTGVIVSGTQKSEETPTAAPVTAAPVAAEIPNKQELVAAVSAAIAEDMGTDVSAIRILSIKRL